MKPSTEYHCIVWTQAGEVITPGPGILADDVKDPASVFLVPNDPTLPNVFIKVPKGHRATYYRKMSGFIGKPPDKMLHCIGYHTNQGTKVVKILNPANHRVVMCEE